MCGSSGSSVLDIKIREIYYGPMLSFPITCVYRKAGVCGASKGLIYFRLEDLWTTLWCVFPSLFYLCV